MGPFVHPGATVLGRVSLGPGSSVFPGAVLRSDMNAITVSALSNIQDNAVLHCDLEHPLTVGACVTVGHGAIVHGCMVGDCVVVGMHSVVMNGAVVGRGSIVAAGAVVKQDSVIPPFSLAAGNPAVVRENRYRDLITPLEAALIYFQLSRHYKSGEPIDPDAPQQIVAAAKRHAAVLNESILAGMEVLDALSFVLRPAEG